MLDVGSHFTSGYTNSEILQRQPFEVLSFGERCHTIDVFFQMNPLIIAFEHPRIRQGTSSHILSDTRNWSRSPKKIAKFRPNGDHSSQNDTPLTAAVVL